MGPGNIISFQAPIGHCNRQMQLKKRILVSVQCYHLESEKKAKQSQEYHALPSRQTVQEAALSRDTKFSGGLDPTIFGFYNTK